MIALPPVAPDVQVANRGLSLGVRWTPQVQPYLLQSSPRTESRPQ